MPNDNDGETSRDREVEALYAMLEYSKARADELNLTSVSVALESAVKLAKLELPAASVITVESWSQDK